MNIIAINILIGVVRHLVGAAGVYLATNGYLDGESAATIVGAVMTIAATVASAASKVRSAK